MIFQTYFLIFILDKFIKWHHEYRVPVSVTFLLLLKSVPKATCRVYFAHASRGIRIHCGRKAQQAWRLEQEAVISHLQAQMGSKDKTESRWGCEFPKPMPVCTSSRKAGPYPQQWHLVGIKFKKPSLWGTFLSQTMVSKERIKTKWKGNI